jgi:ketosteroid isomerase-like protein
MRSIFPRRLALLFALTLVFSPALVSAAPSASNDQTEVVETLRNLFTAAIAEDSPRFHALLTPDFYCFDGGRRYDVESLYNLVLTLHKAGNVYAWSVNDPEVHISGHLAWITYVNRGSITNASGTQQLSWLESAILVKDSGNWRIRFFHSTRVPPAPAS